MLTWTWLEEIILFVFFATGFHVSNAHKTPQFWLLWGVLCLNVSAGIGVLSVAKPMFQEIAASSFDPLIIGAIATGFGALLSLANIIGRIFWASSSDFLGRKVTYAIFFSLGTALYLAAPWAGINQYIATFVLITLVILPIILANDSNAPKPVAIAPMIRGSKDPQHQTPLAQHQRQ